MAPMDTPSTFLDVEKGDLPPDVPGLMQSTSAPGISSRQPETAEFVSTRTRTTSEPVIQAEKKKIEQSSPRSFAWMNLLPLPPALIRHVSDQSNTIFPCAICLENHPLNESFVTANCEDSHRFCKESMTCYLSSQINDGILSFKCPLFGECSGYLSEEEVEHLLPKEMHKKYLRFKAMKDINYSVHSVRNHILVSITVIIRRSSARNVIPVTVSFMQMHILQ